MSFAIGKISSEWASRAQIPFWYEEISTSTNDIAKSDHDITTLKVYFTDLQSAGRGRGPNTWDNEQKGSALLSSWSYITSQNPQPVLSPAFGLAIFTAASSTWPWLHFSLKAPNDLYLNEKKMAGLLVENVSEGNKNKLIIGLGINVFSSPKLETATHLSEQIENIQPMEWCQFLDRILLELTMAIASTKKELTDHQCQSLLFALNKNPNLKEPFTEIQSNGSIKNQSKTINWKEL